MQNTIDYYELLGIPHNADSKDIKRAYHSMQKQCHPDVCGVDGHDMCVLLNEAYATLSSRTKREIYDLELALSKEDEKYTGM